MRLRAHFSFLPTNLPAIKFEGKFPLMLRVGIKSINCNFHHDVSLSLQFKSCIKKKQIHSTPPTPHPSISRWPSPNRLITVLQPQYKNPRIFVQRWTTGQYEHATRQSWIVRRSIGLVGKKFL